MKIRAYGSKASGFSTNKTIISCNNAVILSSCYKVVTHNLSTRCVRNRCVASLSASCNNAVILSSCYKPVANTSCEIFTCVPELMCGICFELTKIHHNVHISKNFHNGK